MGALMSPSRNCVGVIVQLCREASKNGTDHADCHDLAVLPLLLKILLPGRHTECAGGTLLQVFAIGAQGFLSLRAVIRIIKKCLGYLSLNGTCRKSSMMTLSSKAAVNGRR